MRELLTTLAPALRAHFEVDADAIVRAALANLYRQGLIDEEKLNAANRKDQQRLGVKR